MPKVHGLQGHIRNNDLKSVFLLAGYLLIIQLMMMAVWSIGIMFFSPVRAFEDFIFKLWDWQTTAAIPVLVASLVWAALAMARFKTMTADLVGLQTIQRGQEPRLYNITENLAISLGLPMPSLEISESPARNAYAMGLSPETSTIGVTRGLLNSLNDRELNAVIAHEMAHIRNNDTRLITLATIFCGMVFFIGWTLTYRAREMWRQTKADPWKLIGFGLVIAIIAGMMVMGPWRYGFVFALLGIFGSMFLSLVLRFAMFRAREFVADAEAIEFTKDPEALISALVKVEGRNVVEGCDVLLQAMMISATAEGLYATHPAIETRIDAIVEYAAANMRGLTLAPSAERYFQTNSETASATGFSITAMKYPAWISKPLLVIPSFALGYLTFALMQQGFDAVIANIINLPDLIASTAQTKPSVIQITSDGKNLPRSNFWQEFGGGDVMGLLGTFAIAVPIILFGKLLQKLKIGQTSDFIRSLSGQPSMVMRGDYEEEKPTAKLSRLNMAMDKAAQSYHNPEVNHSTQTCQPQPTANGPRVFGKR